MTTLLELDKDSSKNKEDKLIINGTEFLDYATNNPQPLFNSCDRVGQHCYVQCGICKRTAKNAHPLCYQHYLKNNDGNITLMWRSKYPIGCSHENWDGEPWCSGCWTIVNNKPACFHCVKVDWGDLCVNEQQFCRRIN